LVCPGAEVVSIGKVAMFCGFYCGFGVLIGRGFGVFLWYCERAEAGRYAVLHEEESQWTI
jgi:hypothetical protein